MLPPIRVLLRQLLLVQSASTSATPRSSSRQQQLWPLLPRQLPLLPQQRRHTPFLATHQRQVLCRMTQRLQRLQHTMVSGVCEQVALNSILASI